jgi:ATP-dependent RNA helicase DeaD
MSTPTLTSKKFGDFPIKSEILDALSGMGFTHPTEIQDQAIPPLLEGGDLIGQARTGTGKTAAFGIPICQNLKPSTDHVQVLVLTPTRELAQQVAEELAEIGKNIDLELITVYGGVGFEPQIRALRDGVHMVVGTPGRIMDHMRRGNLKLDKVRFLVLDEADRMLDMGFVEDIRWILERCSPKDRRQTMLFSATMPEAIRDLANTFMKNPQFIKVSSDSNLTVESIEQVYYSVGRRNKLWALTRVLDLEERGLMLIFCATKRMVDRLVEDLRRHGYAAEALHGDMSQRKRQQVLDKFKDAKIKVLVATDVAARGLDVDDLTHVINYDLPEEPEVYIHRIGRTGRMGRKGRAISFVSKHDRRQLDLVQRVAGSVIELREPPEPEEEGGNGGEKVKKVIDWEHVSDRFGNCHFTINVGSKDGATMVKIHKLVRGATNLPDYLISNIQVQPGASEFQVPKDAAMRTLEGLRRTSFNGKRVSVELVPQH